MRFLIVDDNPGCRDLFSLTFGRYAVCDAVADGAAALDAFRAALDEGRPYDLVFLDIMMPGTDGHQALNLIRRLEAERGRCGSDAVKVVMVTALAESKHCIRAFSEGCESYVAKPVEMQRLLEVVQSLVGPLSPLPGKAGDSNVPTEPAPSAPSPADAKRFLIVDDDALCGTLLAAMLSPFGQCHFAYDGHEAVDAVRLALEDGRPYDAICLDIMMPHMNGHDALAAVRSVEAQHGVCGNDGAKVLMTTALCNSKHCIQAFREGCESYVAKPIREEDLLAKLHQLGVLAAATA